MRQWAWAIVAIVTLAVWAPVLTYDWVYMWDDAALFYGNWMVRQWNWEWIFRTQYYGHWMPLTWMSASATYALFGYHASAWHAINVVLHTISAVLFYFIAFRMIGSHPGAVVAALLFSIHPLRMESVAWITERKDVLMGVFFLGAILLWMQGRRWWSFAAFVAACASKSPAVMLPVVLLALEWLKEHGGVAYPIENRVETPSSSGATDGARPGPGRYWPLAPFFAVSVIVSVVAFWSLHTILISLPWSAVSLGPRLLHVAYSEVFYVWQTVWPARLSALIEYTWVPSWGQPQYPIAVAVCVLAAVGLARTWRRWPALTAAAACYTVAVLPQSGLFQNGPQLVANRYSYLACLPLALLAGGAVTAGSRRWPRLSLASAAAGLVALIAVTETALPMWRNSDAMWRYAALHEPTCTQCQDMATAADYRDGNVAGALWYTERAMVVSDTTPAPRWERHWNRGVFLLQLGRREEAVAALRTYLALVPDARRDVEVDRDHIARARAALASLGAL
ncbi:MAG: hypothetical protein E6J45_11190 [Chloroflexi bacterium]|nr:MAG: hypothetical protein E6J45_11190 [Chloroflexota bacterium]